MRLCWLHRFVASFSLDPPRSPAHGALPHDRDLPGFVRHHLDTCPECRRVLDAERAVHDRLVATAGLTRLPTPPFLEARILANLGTSIGRVDAGRRLASPMLRAVAAVGVALVAGALVLVLDRWPLPNQPVVRVSSTSAAPAGLEFASLGLPTTRDLTGLSVAFEKPLEGELQLAVNDVRHAAVSLAESLLPESAAQALLRPPGP